MNYIIDLKLEIKVYYNCIHFSFTVANSSLATSDIKDIFCNKSWCQKVDTWFEMFTWANKKSAIEVYLIFYTDFNSLISYFYIYIDLKWRPNM